VTDIIVNPVSGSGAGAVTAESIARELERRGVAYALHNTGAKGDAAAIAAECMKNNPDAVACIGGDGTVQEIVGIMARTDVPFGIIPAGSGNDLVASLYEYKGKGPLYYLEKIILGATRTIDLIKCVAAACGETFYMVNIGSVGIDAEIVHKADDFKKTFGHFAYIVSTVYNAFTYKTGRISVTADDFSYDGGLSLAAVCNGGVYGGGFRIAPSASVDDGLITLCIVQPMSTPEILALFPSVLLGKHAGLKKINFYETKRVEIGYDGIKRLNLDGNIFDCTGPISFEIMPGALTIFS